MRVAEADQLEVDLARVREENAELRGRLSDLSTLESAKKKAESKVEILEEKVRVNSVTG